MKNTQDKFYKCENKFLYISSKRLTILASMLVKHLLLFLISFRSSWNLKKYLVQCLCRTKFKNRYRNVFLRDFYPPLIRNNAQGRLHSRVWNLPRKTHSRLITFHACPTVCSLYTLFRVSRLQRIHCVTYSFWGCFFFLPRILVLLTQAIDSNYSSANVGAMFITGNTLFEFFTFRLRGNVRANEFHSQRARWLS